MGSIFALGIPDVMLIGARAMTNLLEALPASSASFARETELMQSLWSRVTNYLDDLEVTEVCIVVLKKISDSQPAAVHKGANLGSLLEIFGFSQKPTQRTICAIITNLISQLPADTWESIQSILDQLTRLVTYHDQKIAEEVLLCFLILTQYHLSDPTKVQEICSPSLLQYLLEIITSYDKDPGISETAFLCTFKIFVTIAQSSATLLEQLLNMEICSALSTLLKNGISSSTKSGQHTIQIVELLNELLPSLPSDISLSLFVDSPDLGRPYYPGLQFGRPIRAPPSPSGEGDMRGTYYISAPDALLLFNQCGFLPTLVKVFETAVNFPLRSKIMHTIIKIIHYCSGAIEALLETSFSFPSFIAKILRDKDLGLVACGVYLAEISMEKLPQVFKEAFIREGVVDAMKSLNESTLLSPAPKAEPIPKKVKPVPAPLLDELIQVPPEVEVEPIEPPVFDETLAVPVSTKSSRDQLREWILSHVQEFQNRHLNSSDTETKELTQLKEYSSRLSLLSQSDKPFEQNEPEIKEILAVLVGLFQSGISTFEYIKSGCTSHFSRFLTHIPEETSGASKIRKKRIALFVQYFLASKPNTPSGFSSVLGLIQKLIGGDQHFPTLVPTSHVPSAGLKLLLQPFKFHIHKDPLEERLFDYTTPVLVEPLATVKNLGKFFLLKATKKPQPPQHKIKKTPVEKEVTPDEKPLEETLQEEKPAQDEKPKDEKAPEQKTEDDSSSESVSEEQPPSDQYDEEDDQQILDRLEALGQRETAEKVELKGDYVKLEDNEEIGFFLNGKLLRPDLNALQIAQQVAFDRPDSTEPFVPCLENLWQLEIRLEYKIVQKPTKTAKSLSQLSSIDKELAKIPQFRCFNEATHELVSFLWLLHTVYQRADSLCKGQKRTEIPPSEFVNRNAVTKVTSQLEEPLALCSGALPEWCLETFLNCKFLYSYETRLMYFHSVAFDVSRALHAHLSQMEPGETVLTRIQRQKLRIDRNKILPSAIQVLSRCAGNKSSSILSIEYRNEEGVGLGPTKEFFTLVSAEIQRRDLKLWLDNDPNNRDTYLTNTGGLFPAPILNKDQDHSKQLTYFEFLGRFAAKALMDDKLLDIPFSMPFYKLILGEELDLDSLKIIYPDIGTVVCQLERFCRGRSKISTDSTLDPAEKIKKISQLETKLLGCSIEDLGLAFAFAEGPLKENGENIDLTKENVEEYLNLIRSAFLVQGISLQMDAFKKGFNQFFPIVHLRIFSASELEILLCGACQDTVSWEEAEIIEGLSIQAGFSRTSRAITFLLKTMMGFNKQQRRCFLSWVTGTPRLPVGGFRSKQFQKISVFRKLPPEHSIEPDNDLPSVIACFSKLNIPDYSTQEIMLDRILFSMGRTGTGKYTLS